MYVVEICEKMEDTVTVFTKKHSDSVLAELDELHCSICELMKIDVIASNDHEGCSRNWNRSKRRRRVLFFDVHLSRRTPLPDTG